MLKRKISMFLSMVLLFGAISLPPQQVFAESGAQVYFYSDPNYSGAPSSYSVNSDVVKVPYVGDSVNDSFSSVQIVGGDNISVLAFEHSDYKGEVYKINGSISNLSTLLNQVGNADNKISSLIIFKNDATKPFNQLSFLMTHNSYSNKQDNPDFTNFMYAVENQHISVNSQMQDGVRGFMLDTYWYNGDIICSHKEPSSYGFNKKFISYLQEMKQFLDTHPDEIITIVLEDYVKNQEIKNRFIQAGLQDYIFNVDKWDVLNTGWPTAKEMRAANKRLLVFTSSGESVDQDFGVHYEWDYVNENVYSSDSVDSSTWCKWRKYKNNPNMLFLMNHFPTFGNSDSNDYGTIDNHVKDSAIRPNFIAFDYYDHADGSPSNSTKNYIADLNAGKYGGEYYPNWLTAYYGDFGKWKAPQVADPMWFVVGAQVKFEDSQGSGDDTAMNGLKLVYRNSITGQEMTQLVWEGNWGTWKDVIKATSGYYAYAAQVRYENSGGSSTDDTAMNGLKLKFRNPNTGATEEKLIYEGNWGEWKPWVEASSGYYFAGGRVRYEDSQGGGDDTGMNGLMFCIRSFDRITFYQDANFGGNSTIGIKEGSYTLEQLESFGFHNDWSSSVIIPSNYKVELYSDNNFQGTKWMLDRNDYNSTNFCNFGGNDVVSSVKIIKN